MPTREYPPYLVNKPMERLTESEKRRWEEASDRNNVQSTEAFHKAVTSQWNRENRNNIRY